MWAVPPKKETFHFQKASSEKFHLQDMMHFTFPATAEVAC